MRVYIVNGRVTRKKLDDRSHCGYFRVYVATTGFILYWKPDQTFFIHRYHHVCFDKYNSRLSIWHKNTQSYLLLQKYPGSLIHNSDILNLIPCELDLTSTKFSNTKIITYEIDLPPSGNKIGFNLLDVEDFTINYVTDKKVKVKACTAVPPVEDNSQHSQPWEVVE